MVTRLIKEADGLAETNNELAGFQCAVASQTWKKQRPMLVSRYEETHLGDISNTRDNGSQSQQPSVRLKQVGGNYDHQRCKIDSEQDAEG